MHSKEYDVYQIIVHPEFDIETDRHDIALLHLGTTIHFTEYVHQACLPERDFLDGNLTGIVIGWGRNEFGAQADVLMESQMYVPSKMDCLDSHRDFYGLFLNDGNFCAGHLARKSVTCPGDSGGGLYFEINGAWYVGGIVSIGVRERSNTDCDTNHYVLYTDVFKHMSWIRQYI